MFNYLIVIILLFAYSCVSSPRYNSEMNSKAISQKKSKNKDSSGKKNVSINKNKKKYTGVSSWYGEDFHGNLTANGEVYDMYGITAAHKEFPLNTWARVTNLDNDNSIILRINDRGPYISGRILDCSYGAAKKLGFVDNGTANVKIEIIEWGDDEYMHHN